MHSSIEALALAVTLGMIRGGTTLGDAIDLAQFLNHFTLKIPPLVAVDPLWYPKPHNPFLHQHPCHIRIPVTSSRAVLDGEREQRISVAPSFTVVCK